MFSELAEKIKSNILELEKKLQDLESRSKLLDQRIYELKSNQAGSHILLSEKIKYFPFSSRVDAEFWKQLADRKLNMYRLSDEPVEIFGTFSVSSQAGKDRAWLELRAGSFDYASAKAHMFPHEFLSSGALINFNTLEKFKECDKNSLLASLGRKLLDEVESGAIFDHPVKSLTRFALITFADLKNHKNLYWFGFPAFSYFQGDEPRGEVKLLKDAIPGFFEILSRYDFGPDNENSFFFVSAEREIKSFKLLKDITGIKPNIFGFFDPSPNKEHPSWFLRNFIFFASHPNGLNLGGEIIRVICIRDVVTSTPREPNQSTVWEIKLPLQHNINVVTGWEPNVDNKMGPKLVNLSEMLDSSKLSEAACNLNLRLMKWRAFPDLNETLLASCRVLLFGAGTLGCAVSRGLMGWGFKHFTFCDNGKVSYSNPVRQSLYFAEDCHAPSRWKAEVAAERCKQIYPSVKAEFWVGSIPMPGHSGDPKIREDFQKVEELILSHDVICLLTDTRESRWLPTVLGAAYNKIVLNAALGFDSYVVMRHGTSESNPRLSCYFCSDIMAPQDSTKDRTLDQQCTVTRPGVAPIASAILVELLVNILHHPLGNAAPALTSDTRLGIIPHQVRGYLGGFQNTLISGPSFPQCTACSDYVVKKYVEEGFSFIYKVLEHPTWLEEITGINHLKNFQLQASEEFCVEDEDF